MARDRTPGTSGIATPSAGRGTYTDSHQRTGTAPPKPAPMQDAHDRVPPSGVKKWIIKRQRTLKAAGYKVVVDGTWGPRSQRAWLDYRRRQNRARMGDAHDRAAGRRIPGSPREAREQKKEDAAFQKALRQEQLRRDRIKRQAQQKAAVMERARKLREDYRVASRMTLRQLSSVLVDDEAGMKVGESKIANRALQFWLRTRGYQDVKVTGKFDRTTYKAVQAAQKRADLVEQRKRARAIADELYGRAGVKPGETHSWFPMKKVPTPVELDAILQKGGFTAQLIVQTLLKHAAMIHHSPMAQFNHWREFELRKLAAQHDPMLASFMAVGGEPNMLWAYASIFGAVDLVPYPDLSQIPPEFHDDAWKARAENQKVRAENASRVGSLRAQAAALVGAKDEQEFKAELLRQVAQEEAKFLAFQKELAANSVPWWGKVVEAVLLPGEMLRVGGTAYFLSLKNRVSDPLDPDGYVSYQEAQEVYDELPWGGRLAFEIVADPLNFIAPLRITSTMAKVGTLAVGAKTALGSYKLVGTGRLWERALVYEKGTWGKAATADRVILAGIGGSRFQPAYEKLLEEGRKVTQLRQTAVANATSRAVVQMRHGFRKPTEPNASKAWKGKTPPKKVQVAINEAMGRVESWLERAPETVRLLDALVQDRVSLYVDSGRQFYSNVGATIWANLTEKARVASIHQLATDGADDVSKSVLAAGADGIERIVGRERATQLRSAWESEGGEMSFLNYVQRVLLNEEYARMVDEAGVYITGGRGGDVLLNEQIAARTGSKMDDIEYIIIPALQNILERRLAAEAVELWSKQGLWAFRHGEAANSIRALGRESFDDDVLIDVPNPAFGHGHTLMQMHEAVEHEVRRSGARVFQYEARNAYGGTLPEGFDAGAEVEQIRETIQSKWTKKDDGLYYDTRETVEVSRLYARQLGEAYQGVKSGAKSLRDIDELAELPEFLVAGGGVDEDMWRLMWTMGSRFGYRDTIHHPTRKMFLPDTSAAKDRKGRDAIRDKEFARGARLNKAVAEAKIALDKAYAHSYSYELARERLYFVALAKHEARWAKFAYMGLYGSMAVWRFATLPLRPGWVVRNTIDNVVKLFIQGVRDPRYFMRGGAGAPGRTVFDTNIKALREAAVFLDRMFNTNAADYLDAVTERLWDLEASVINRIFTGHGLVELPEGALERARFLYMDAPRSVAGRAPIRLTPEDFRRAGMAVPKDLAEQEADRNLAKRAENARKFLAEVDAHPGTRAEWIAKQPAPEKAQHWIELAEELIQTGGKSLSDRLAERIKASPGVLWELMASRPENYMKRVLYRSTYDRAMRRALASGRYMTSRPVLTAVADEAGQPRTVYHGTTAVFENFDPTKLDSDDALLFGRGFYFTESPQLGSEYAESVRRGVSAYERGTPNVRLHRLSMRRPLDLDQRLSSLGAAERESLAEFFRRNADAIVEDARPGDSLSVREMTLTQSRDETVDALADIIRTADDEPIRELVDGTSLASWADEADEAPFALVPPELWKDAFRSLGYDGYTHVGGHITSGEKHRVWIAWDVDQIVSPHEWVDEVIPDEVAASKAAHIEAWDAIEQTLFDYSKISVAEENLKVFFPFIQFWRKNTQFWMRTAVEKPWVPLAVLKFDQERQKATEDLPQWLRRYIHVEDIADAAGVVPGLDHIVQDLLPDDAMYDPMSFLSFAPLYRTYRNLAYGDNQFLPGENPGMAILGPMIDAMNDWGLSMNPLVRKPLEHFGVASERAWQTMFPQTNLVSAMTRRFLGDEAALRVADWESAFDKLPFGVSSDSIAESFEFYVQQEIAGQVKRGWEPDREKAEATIRAWFVTQNVWGYFAGFYFRRATPEDIYLAKLVEQPYEDLTDREKNLLNLWSMRGMDRLTYNRYIEMLPLIEAYYRLDDPGEKAEFVKENPELRRYVHSAFRGKPWDGEWMRRYRRYSQTDKFMEALRVVEAVDPAPDVREAAMDIFSSQQLRDYWKENDTPEQLRQRQVKGEVRRYFKQLNETYFSIPETDFEARNSFVDEHPELIRYWNRNNDPSDDYEAILSAANAALREMYFAVVEAEGWDAAAGLLKQHPFMFEDTDAAQKVDEDKGEWIPGRGKWSAERIEAWRKAKPHMTWFFDTFMPKVGEDKAWAWLNDSDTDAAKIMRDYFKRFPSKKRLDYMKASPWLAKYFGMPPEERGEWLRGGSEGAKIVLSFFEKYGSEKGLSQHARDYLASKPHLDYYFSLPKETRSAWLNSDDARAKEVLAYFKKYGKQHAYERLVKKFPKLARGTPEQRKRIEFWRQFYSLTPDQRPLFVMKEAEAHGVFIYGEFGEAERHDQQMEWDRRAVGLGLSERQKAWLYVRPLLEFYRTLPKDEKSLFLRANPELQEYFDKYTTKSMTGDKKLDALVEEYFKLPPGSILRSQFLRKHPQVQDWFDDRSSPAERAMRNALEQYFELRNAWERKDFLLDHPEVAAYFERRREEKANESELFGSFDRADPRLRPFYEDADDLIRAAERMREKLRRSTMDALGDISVRRERRAA